MSTTTFPQLSLSIVSHGQGSLIRELLSDLLMMKDKLCQVIVTLNIPEDESFLSDFVAHLPILIIRNEMIKGFGSNHNNAFLVNKSDFFIVVNPDIRLHDFNLNELVRVASIKTVGVAAPAVYSKDGCLEDSARHFPTIAGLVRRKFFGYDGLDYKVGLEPLKVDWVAGMFMVFRSETYRSVGGFNDRFFMYFEDVDLCRRLSHAGLDVILMPQVCVIHEARRASRRSLRHFLWHLSSAYRYLIMK